MASAWSGVVAAGDTGWSQAPVMMQAPQGMAAQVASRQVSAVGVSVWSGVVAADDRVVAGALHEPTSAFSAHVGAGDVGHPFLNG